MRDVGRSTFVLVFVCYRIVCISFFLRFFLLVCLVGWLYFCVWLGLLCVCFYGWKVCKVYYLGVRC